MNSGSNAGTITLHKDTITVNIAHANGDSADNASMWEYSINGGTTWIVGRADYRITLEDGSYDLQIRQTDNVGNVSEVTSQTISVDTQPPTAPSLTWTADTGTVGDNITHNGELNVGIEVNATWEYSVDGGHTWRDGSGAELTTGVKSISGNIISLADTVADSSISIQVRQTDWTGTPSPVTTLENIQVLPQLSATLSITMPVADTDAESGFLNSNEVTVKGLSGAAWQYSVDGGSTWIQGTAPTSGQSTFTLTDASYNLADIQVREVDNAGVGSVVKANTSGSVVIDTAVPNTPIISLASDTGTTGDNITSNGTINVAGLETNARWFYSVDGGSTWHNSAAASTAVTTLTGDSLTLVAGFNGSLKIKQLDQAGNESIASIDSIKVVAAPSTTGVVINLPDNTNDDNTDNTEVSVEGLGSNSWMYTIDGGATWFAGSGNSFNLADGTYAVNKIGIKIIDDNGNVSDAMYKNASVTVDTVVPEPAIISITDTGTLGDNITTDGTITVSNLEAGATWEYRIGSGAWRSDWTSTSATGATFSINAGTYAADQIQVRQTDSAGNVSEIATNSAQIEVQGALNALTVELAAVSATDADGAHSTNGVVNVSGIAIGATWQYSVDSGATWITGGTNMASTTASFNLADGTYADNQIQVRQMNAVQSQTNIANTVATAGDITIDTSTPSTPIIAYNHTGDDGQTNDASVTISGLVVGYSYSINGATAQEVTTSTIIYTLAEGSNSIRVVQTNDAGTSSATANLSVVLDTTSPNLASIDVGTDGYTDTDSFSVSNISAGDTWQYSLDNGATWNDGSGTGATLSGLTANASNTIQVKVTDAAGNTSVSGKTVIYDATAPSGLGVALNNTTDTDGVLNDGQVSVTGIEAGATWSYRLNGTGEWITGGTNTTSSTANAHFMLTEANGTVTKIEVRQVDKAGNEEVETLTSFNGSNSLVIDTIAPSITASVSGNTISGTASEDMTLYFDTDGVAGAEKELSVSAGDTWSIDDVTADTASGGLGLTGNGVDTSTLSISATDSAGNNSLDNLDLLMKVDTEAPTVFDDFKISDDVAGGASSTLNSGDWTNDNQPTFEGTTENGATVKLTIGGQSYETIASSSDGSWQITPGKELDEGLNSYDIDVTDSAGNRLDATSGTLNVDTTAPNYSSASGAETVSYSSDEADTALTSISFDVSDVGGINNGTSNITALLTDGNGNEIKSLDASISNGKATVNIESGDNVTHHDSSHDVVITITDTVGNETHIDTDI